jgi:hypothetical protein
VLKTFAVNYRFKHPDQEDFFTSMSASSSVDLTEFVGMFVEGTARVDYAIEKIKFERIKAAGDSGITKFSTYVTIERKLGGSLPQTVTVGFDDGAELTQIWDGKDRTRRIEFEGNSRPLWASIDKEISYAIDENMNNNTIYLEGHMSRMISFEWDAIFIIEFLASIFL